MTRDRVRWMVKKLARGAMGYGSWASGSLAVRRALADGPCVRALTYHRFGDAPGDPFTVPAPVFEAQMRWLAERGLLVSLADVEDFVAGRKPLRADAVLVTIDDGSRSLSTVALPILRAHGVPAVAFVTAGLVGNEAAAAGEPEPYLDWEQLGRVAQAGIAIGSHAYDHVSMGRLSPGQAEEQACRSRELLEARLGLPVRSFAYPFGTRSDFDAATDAVVAAAGYTTAFTAVHGAIRPGMAPIGLPRVKIEHGDGPALFRLACRGGLDAWRAVDELLWRLQLARHETRA